MLGRLVVDSQIIFWGCFFHFWTSLKMCSCRGAAKPQSSFKGASPCEVSGGLFNSSPPYVWIRSCHPLLWFKGEKKKKENLPLQKDHFLFLQSLAGVSELFCHLFPLWDFLLRTFFYCTLEIFWGLLLLFLFCIIIFNLSSYGEFFL